MIRAEKKFMGWFAPISLQQKSAMTCRWDISCWGRTGAIVIPWMIPDERKERLDRPRYADGGTAVIPATEWSFAHVVQGQLTPDPHYVHLEQRICSRQDL